MISAYLNYMLMIILTALAVVITGCAIAATILAVRTVIDAFKYKKFKKEIDRRAKNERDV